MLFILPITLFVLKILNFCHAFFGHVGKRLDKRARVKLQIYDFNNLEMKFGQLIKYNVRNIFLQKCRKLSRKVSSKPYPVI